MQLNDRISNANSNCNVRHKLDLTKLSDEELAQLACINAKAQMTFIEDDHEIENTESNEINE